jgi:DNA-binding beta-propeller fold protein YncE
MKRQLFARASVALLATTLATAAFSQTPGPPLNRAPATQYAVERGPAKDGTPAWYILGSHPDPGGRTRTEPGGKVTILSRPAGPAGAAGPAGRRAGIPEGAEIPPPCRNSPICTNPIGPARGSMQRITYEQTMGYRYTFPYNLPEGVGGVPAVALDSKGNLWAYQRQLHPNPQLYKFDASAKLILSVPVDVTGYAPKAHGMAVDADDNVWILDTGLATAKKLSPDGKLLMTIGTTGKRGDWDEAKGQRLLWEPVMIAFGRNGDIYIAEGHGHESPNDHGNDTPHNNLGNSRIIHLDKTGKFKAQYFGNNNGPGKFYSAHGLAVDPKTGDLWIGDREDYRIVVLSADGKFVKTIQTTGLVCAIQFDAQGEPWYASGQDGQFLKMNRDGKVLGAVGTGMGIGPGQFIEASYWVFDKQNNLYAGDTSVSRITKMVRSPGAQRRR